MPTYIMLANLTPEGVQTVKNNPQRIHEVNKEVEQLGAKVTAQWATLGRFDFLSIVQAPDEQTMARVSLELKVRAERCATSRSPRSRWTSSSPRCEHAPPSPAFGPHAYAPPRTTAPPWVAG